MNFRFSAVFAALMFVATVSPALPTPDAATSIIVIQNATVLTVSHGTIERGSILIRDGKIAEVGLSVKVPKEAMVIDAAGQFVMPGIIDAIHTSPSKAA
jgi:adenine deaminase